MRNRASAAASLLRSGGAGCCYRRCIRLSRILQLNFPVRFFDVDFCLSELHFLRLVRERGDAVVEARIATEACDHRAAGAAGRVQCACAAQVDGVVLLVDAGGLPRVPCAIDETAAWTQAERVIQQTLLAREARRR